MAPGQSGPVGAMITSVRSGNAAHAAARAQRQGAPQAKSGFEAGAGAAAVSASVTARPASAIAPLDALMALQTVDDPAGRRARAVRRGSDILDDLDTLKLDILSGRVPRRTLARLVDRIEAERAGSGDADLDALLDDIELRARVELAKLENT